MENTVNRKETLFEQIEEFAITSFELYKLKTISKTVEIISSFVTRGLVVLVVSVSLIFASIGAAFWIGDELGKSYLGFFCVAIFYMMLGVFLLFVFNKLVKRKIGNSIIADIFND
jgi:hypothetical protein